MCECGLTADRFFYAVRSRTKEIREVCSAISRYERASRSFFSFFFLSLSGASPSRLIRPMDVIVSCARALFPLREKAGLLFRETKNELVRGRGGRAEVIGYNVTDDHR